MTMIVNLTTAPVELSTGVMLAPAGGADEAACVVSGFTVTAREHQLADAGKVQLVAEDGDETVDDLRRRAAELGIEGRSKMTRDELVAAIAETDSGGNS